MKILLIDYLSPKGHAGWLRLQFDSFVSLGHDVSCVFREGFNEVMGIPDSQVLFQIPSSYYTTQTGIKYRLECLKILLYIKNRTNEKEWDSIILSSYETISLGLMPVFKRAIIVNHNNLSDLGDSRFKKALFGRVSNRYTQIAFNEVIGHEIERLSHVKPIIVPHGLLNIVYNDKPSLLSKYHIEPNKYIVVPTKTQGDFNESVITSICNTNEFNTFIKNNDIKMILRRKVQIDEKYSGNYVLIDGFLGNDEYYTLLANSYAVLLCLNEKRYSFRVSGAIFESMKIGFPIFVYNNSTLDYYSQYGSGRIMFSTPKELIVLLSNAGNFSWLEKIKDIADPSAAWARVLLECSNNDNHKNTF